MNPKYEITGRSTGRPSAAFAAAGSPGRKRSRSTEFGTTVEPTPKTSATSWLIAIDVSAKRLIAERTNSERRSRAALGQRRAQVPDDREPLALREPGGRDQRRVVEVDELEAVAAQRPPELDQVRRELRELAQEEQPAPAAVRRGPDVREPGDGAGVHVGARLAEELGRRARRAVDVRLELLRRRARGSGTRATPAPRRARSGGGRAGSACGLGWSGHGCGLC